MSFSPADGPVLITQSQLTRFAGSEMVVLELVEHLTQRGIRVIVVTHALGDQVEAELTASGLVAVHLSDAPELDARLVADPPVYAWIQHQLVPGALLTGAVSCPMVFAHLSAQLSIEFPLSPIVEAALGTVIAFNSEETLAQQRAAGILDAFDSGRILVLGNPAPDAFAALAPLSAPDARRPALLVVSNHIPDEVLEAVELIRDRFDVRLVGRERDKGASPERVRPETVEAADAVLSIGKTVQYTLVAGRPVYCYDHFGGPGWLDDASMAEAGRRNFSGRGFSSKSAQQIADELSAGFDAARSWASARQAESAAEFALASRIEDIERRLQDWTPAEAVLPEVEIVAFTMRGELIRRFVADWADSVVRGERLEEKIRALRDSEARAREAAEDRAGSLDRMSASRDASREHAKEVEALLEQAKERMKSLEADRSRFLSDLARVSRERDALQGERDALRTELAEATSGVVWRMTEKARRLGRR